MTTIFLLLLSNLMPIVGALFFGWDVGVMMLAYWCETAILGFYNVLKIIKANGQLKVPDAVRRKWGQLNPSKVGLVLFFIFHFGMFMFGHFIFLNILIFLKHPDFFTVLLSSSHSFLISLFMTFFTHGVSFQKNFIEGGEWKRVDPVTQMTKVYGRVAFMHFSIFIVAFVLVQFGLYANLAAISALALFKAVLDVYCHYRSHLAAVRT